MQLSKEFVEQLSEIFFPETSFEDVLNHETMQMSFEKNQKVIP